MMCRRRFVEPVLLKLGINRLGKAGFCKAEHLRSFDAEKLLQLGRRVALDDRIMGKVAQNFGAALLGEVLRDQDEVQRTFAAQQRLTSDQQAARAQYKGK